MGNVGDEEAVAPGLLGFHADGAAAGGGDTLVVDSEVDCVLSEAGESFAVCCCAVDVMDEAVGAVCVGGGWVALDEGEFAEEVGGCEAVNEGVG